MGRLFSISSHICAGESGGGHGVIFRLYTADKKYKLLNDEAIYIFRDLVITDDLPEDYKLSKPKQKSEFRKSIQAYIPNSLRIMKMKRTIQGIKDYLETLNQKFVFTDDDVFILHDFRVAYAFLSTYTFSRTAFVFHMQGSIYYEWHAETGISSTIMKRFFDSLFIFITKNVKVLCFPSKGTEESLIHSEPELLPYVDAVEKRYLYNGVACPEVDEECLPAWVLEIKGKKGYKFVTIANLNKAKAIERIPQYLNGLNASNIEFCWVLVGNGVQAAEVELEIQKYQLGKNVVWIKEPVAHDQLMALLSVTDFYILLHRYSIFDLSTLEAMHYGNIPILTPVGGNKEMIIRKNGIFVNDFSDVSELVELIRSGTMDEKKQLNKDIQNCEFDDSAFLKRYQELYQELRN